MNPYSPHSSSGQSGQPHELSLASRRVSSLLDAANGEDPSARAAVHLLIRNRASDLPSGFLEEAARTVRYASIAQALLSNVDSMSYIARKTLAQKFQQIGRDECVMYCLANATPHDGEGLRTLCEAALRGRFIRNRKLDLRSLLFAASFEDTRAEVAWIRYVSLREHKGRELERSVQRLVELAQKERSPEALNSIGEMLLSNELSSFKPDTALYSFKRAALMGYAPAKLNLLRNFPQEHDLLKEVYLADFFNESHFPGLKWCYATVRSEERSLRLIDGILKAYLWHPDLPVGTKEEISTAVAAAEELPGALRSLVAHWAQRNNILVMDGRYPAVRAE